MFFTHLAPHNWPLYLHEDGSLQQPVWRSTTHFLYRSQLHRSLMKKVYMYWRVISIINLTMVLLTKYFYSLPTVCKHQVHHIPLLPYPTLLSNPSTFKNSFVIKKIHLGIITPLMCSYEKPSSYHTNSDYYNIATAGPTHQCYCYTLHVYASLPSALDIVSVTG